MRFLRNALPALCALALLATPAHAGGINLSWNDCGAFGQAQRNFACNTNTGVNVMYASAISPFATSQLIAAELSFDLQTNQSALSPWWHLSSIGCRPTSFTTNSNFVTGPFSCADLWGGQAAGGVDYVEGFGAPNRARVHVSCAVPFQSPVSMDGASEYYLVALAINNAKSTGTGSCAGCTDAACIVFNDLILYTSDLATHRVTNPILRQYISWQGDGSSVHGGCPGATPSHNRTWGSVKSLYR
jgi:hypothetical protein